jgi:dGTP triphosphohydrolase
MNKIDEINKARSLLSSALAVALNSMPNNHSVQDARIHMRKALNELDNVAKTEVRKKNHNQEQANTWWKNIVSGVANQPVGQEAMSKEAQQWSLDKLNKAIDSEKSKLDELEKQTDALTDTELLSD